MIDETLPGHAKYLCRKAAKTLEVSIKQAHLMICCIRR